MKKYYTGLLPVKIISFVLIVVLAFITLNRAFSIDNTMRETGVFPDVIVSNIPADQLLFDSSIGNAYYHAMQVLYYGSEDSIRAGEKLVWLESENGVFLNTPDGRHSYGFLPYPVQHYYPYSEYDDYGDDSYDYGSQSPPVDIYYGIPNVDTPAQREQKEQSAIEQQLNEFRRAKRELQDIEGLYFYLQSGTSPVTSNVAGDAEWFLSQPVYSVLLPDLLWPDPFYSASHEFTYSYHYYDLQQSLPYNDATVCLALRADTVYNAQIAYATAREAYIRDITIIAISAVLAVILLFVLLLGAGRKFGAEGVHFTLIDRPFLDISLAAVSAWVGLALFVSIGFFDITPAYQNQNLIVIYIFSAAMTAATVPVTLLWLMSFSKRLKAGRFWQHTLIYFIPSRVCSVIVRYVKRFWCGFPLMMKVSLIICASSFLLLIIGLVGVGSHSYGATFLAVLIATAVVAFFLLTFTRRLHELDEGARKTSLGGYNEEIKVGSGELGSIASSINNISSGINTAVEQRMKSERLRTELITNVSHDIRTPLTSIITYTDLLKHEGLDNEKAPEYLDVLMQKSQRLKTLTDELFEAAKAASGNIDVTITDLDLVSLINQVLGELEGAIKNSGLDLRVNLPERLDIKSDGKLMWRIMENLLSNVFKYSLSGSRVYLNAFYTFETSGAEGAKTAVRIELKNISATELNIDPSELTERFKRSDDSRTDGGNGLGLSIVQSFAAALGGRFEISIDGDLFKATVLLPI